ncbi:MAG: hypothetical protein ACREN5_07610 [Gemmatimonadales bacterium]
MWTRGGQELVYRKGDSVMAVSVDLVNVWGGQPRLLFAGPYADNPGWTRPRRAPWRRASVVASLIFVSRHLLPLLALLACSEPVSPRPAAFETDAPAYTLATTAIGYEGSIGFVFTNPNAGPAYIVNCQGATSLHLEKRVGTAWRVAWAPAINACLSAPIVVAPGAQYRGVVRIIDCSFRTNCAPRFAVPDIAGQYRLVWTAVLSSYDDRRYPFGGLLPLEQRISNAFRISTATP